MRIEFLTECTGWDPGFQADVETEDTEYYYFNDVNDRWTCVEKTKEGVEFIIVEEDFMCGGKDVTYKRLIERAEGYKKSQL